MATISTRNAIVYLQGSGAVAVTLTEAKEVSIDLDRELIDDTCFGDLGWRTNMLGLDSWSGSITANFDTTQTLLLDSYIDSATDQTPRALYVYPDRSASTKYYYGSIWPKLSIGLPLGLATATLSFTGDGAFGYKP